MKKIHICVIGTFTPMQGGEISFTEADLKAVADNYDTNLHEAPIVVGHPKTDDPAFGWIGGVSFSEGKLYAHPRQVNPAFSEMVDGGSYKKVSAEFYAPGAKANPTPGQLSLKHVGFLGGTAPAIKGLEAIQFNETEDGETIACEISLAEGDVGGWVISDIGRLLGKIANYLFQRDGDDFKGVVNPDEANWIIESGAYVAGQQSAQEDPNSSFSEIEDPPSNENTEDTMTKEELDAGKARLEADVASFAETQNTFRKKTLAADVDALIALGKVIPAQKDFVVSFAATLSVEGETISFSEGKAAQDLSQADAFMAFLKSQPDQISFSEQSGENGDGDDIDSNDSTAIAAEAVSFREEQAAKGITITTTNAVAHVMKGAKS